MRLILFEDNGSGDYRNLLLLIAKCERLVAELKSDDSGQVEEILSLLAKLKSILLESFKKRQHKMLDLYWKKIEQENEEFSLKMNELAQKAFRSR